MVSVAMVTQRYKSQTFVGRPDTFAVLCQSLLAQSGVYVHPGKVCCHATGWLSPLEHESCKTKVFLQTMSALQYSQTVGCSPATCAVALDCCCGESAAGASLAGHRCGCARCCCCDGAGAAAFGLGGPLLVAGCGSLAVAGDLAGVVEHVDWFDEVFA